MKMNKLIMIGVLALAVVAISGIANAVTPSNISVNVNTIQTNGKYIGVPTLLVNSPGQYGYNYTFTPDGTYTVFGTVKNVNNSTNGDVNVWIKVIGSETKEFYVHVPAAVDHYYVLNSLGNQQTLAYSYTSPSTVDFSVTVANTTDKVIVKYGLAQGNELNDANKNNVDYVDAAEGVHTVNQGPMSNMVVVLNNGIVNSSASVLYTLNQSSDDYKALYTNGNFDFKSSPLYSFV